MQDVSNTKKFSEEIRRFKIKFNKDSLSPESIISFESLKCQKQSKIPTKRNANLKTKRIDWPSAGIPRYFPTPTCTKMHANGMRQRDEERKSGQKNASFDKLNRIGTHALDLFMFYFPLRVLCSVLFSLTFHAVKK